MTLAVLIAYICLVLAVGVGSTRLFRGTGEDYFLATRTIGPFVLLMSLFGTHMTAFSLLGASGEAYRTGVGVFGLMASSSALVAPTVFFLVGVPLWSVGKREGLITQVQYFRSRFDSNALGLLLFVVLVALLVPYLLIGVMGAGLALRTITGGAVAAWVGSAAVCVVVMTYVTAGGLRGTAWANTLQTLVFMVLGALTFVWIVRALGGVGPALERVAAERPELLVRGGAIPPLKMLTYLGVPLSVAMFPHIFMHWLTAQRASTFRLAIVAYPLCLVVVWVPSVLLGVLGSVDVPGLAGPAANDVLVRLIERHAPTLVAGLLGAGVFAAIMSSLDSQVLSLGTMFTQDIVRHHGLHGGMSERAQVLAGRLFVAGILLLTFVISLVAPPSIFRLGIWSFTGFAALSPLAVAALYWRRTTAAGAVACVLATAATWGVLFARGFGDPGYTIGGTGVMPVALLLAVSTVVLVVVSLVTRPPAPATVARYMPAREARP